MDKNSPRLTIKDIAKLSGVGKSTVSRVINGDANVKQETRELVEQIISQHQFVPSKSARAMRGYSNKAIGIIVSRLDSASENQAISAILPLLYQHGFDPIIVESQFDRKKVIEHLKMFAQRQIDGLIIFAFTGLEPDLLIEWQNRAVVMARPFKDFHSIYYDDRGAIMQLMNYFHHQQQYTQIGYIGINEQDVTTGQLRYLAYLDFCHQHQLVPSAKLGEMNYHSGYQFAAELVKQYQSTRVAIVCATDTIALGVNKYLQVNNITHIAVGSIGQSKLLHFLFPNTVSVHLGFSEAGILAAQTLLTLLKKPAPATYTIVPSTLPIAPI
ncbi:trehalose operon repressor TreR [Orbus sturtevantii]|uniref:trehalose operon repressor TreR n=1 Tax=Orbus sturtevantii TaxID=3074109 RepID=UPI00370D184B